MNHPNPAPSALAQQLSDFVDYRKQYLTGDEKGEAQVFCDRFFQALGHGGVREAGATLEMRLKKNDSKGTAFADLMWKPRCLIEMKKAGTDLSRHYRQAFDYWVAAVPDRPRFVVLCNFDEFWIYDFDRQLDVPVDKLTVEDLPRRHDALAFMLPVEEKPVFGNDLVEVTREAAAQVATLFRAIHSRGIDRPDAQRFTLQCVMAMFSEDIGLLPGKFFTRALEDASTPRDAYDLLGGLFQAMNAKGDTPGGRFAGTPYFNGGLFAKILPVELNIEELTLLRLAATTDWSAVRPEIFGTLFEGSMSAGERHAQGAHFTSQADIAKVVMPTIVSPWRERIAAAGTIAELTQLLDALRAYRVLDPACGSGNFLYVAYRELRRLEREVQERIADRRKSEGRAGQQTLSYVTPDHFFGIDINPFAVEIAKVTMLLAKKLAADELHDDQQVLPLDNLDRTIVAEDALFNPWPRADAIVGNPPYLGRRKMVQELGAAYCDRLATTFPNVGGVSDYVTYWFPLVHDRLPDGGRAGLVATNTIRQNDSRRFSLDYVVDNGGTITDAVATQPWSGDAVVHVSIINWLKGKQPSDAKAVLWLNDGNLRLETPHISSALSPDVDVRSATPLSCNTTPQVCFQGQTPGVTDGFVIDSDTRASLANAEPACVKYIHPFIGGRPLLHDLTVQRWIIDLPHADVVTAEAEVPALMAYLRRNVLSVRKMAADGEAERNRKKLAQNPNASEQRHHANFLAQWWQLSYRRSELLTALSGLDRYLVTTRVAAAGRATVFAFVNSAIRPSDALTTFALADDYSFGVLSSSLHRAWLDARCSTLKGDPRYTSTTVFDSFPWPQNASPADVSAIGATAAEILQERQKHMSAGASLRVQYDALMQPGKSHLRDLHERLDKQVNNAYGFDALADPLSQLLALNQLVEANPDTAVGPGPNGLAAARVSKICLEPPTP